MLWEDRVSVIEHLANFSTSPSPPWDLEHRLLFMSYMSTCVLRR